MLNYIWAGMILLSLATAVITGRVDQTVGAAFTGAGEAVTLLISMLGIMCLWTGLMKIAERSGAINLVKHLIKPLTKRIFKEIPQDSAAMDYICANISANIFGLGNAATPFGIMAMKNMQKYSPDDSATDAMCIFVVMNTASLQLVPTTIIAMRASLGSADPARIIPAVWAASLCAMIFGLAAAYILSKREK